MKQQITRTVQADEDIIEIWTYIAGDNLDAADALLDKFDAKLELLLENPRLGPSRDDIAPGMRFLPVGNFLLLYRQVTHGIELVRVVHGARNLLDLLIPQPPYT